MVTTFGITLCSCVGGSAPANPYDNSQLDAGSGGTNEAGSGGSSGTTSEVPLQAGAKNSHYPLVDGATWTYHHEYPQDPGKMPWDEVTSLRATTYMDKPAFILENKADPKGERSASTLLVDGTRVDRVYKEVRVADKLAFTTTYDPGFSRYDEALLHSDDSEKLTYVSEQNCMMTSTASKCAPGTVRKATTTHTFKVLSLHTEVTVAAGTFDTIGIERTNLGDPTVIGDEETKRYWYAAGVGKVREEDLASGATEELSTFNIP